MLDARRLLPPRAKCAGLGLCAARRRGGAVFLLQVLLRLSHQRLVRRQHLLHHRQGHDAGAGGLPRPLRSQGTAALCPACAVRADLLPGFYRRLPDGGLLRGPLFDRRASADGSLRRAPRRLAGHAGAGADDLRLPLLCPGRQCRGAVPAADGLVALRRSAPFPARRRTHAGAGAAVAGDAGRLRVLDQIHPLRRACRAVPCAAGPSGGPARLARPVALAGLAHRGLCAVHAALGRLLRRKRGHRRLAGHLSA